MALNLVVNLIIFSSLLRASPGVAQRQPEICSKEYFVTLRECVQKCVGCTNYTPRIEDVIGCGQKVYEECWCRPEFGNWVSAMLTSCVKSRCTPYFEKDVTLAEGVWNTYCSDNGYSGFPVEATTTDNGGIITTETGTGPTPTNTAIVVATLPILSASSGGIITTEIGTDPTPTDTAIVVATVTIQSAPSSEATRPTVGEFLMLLLLSFIAFY